MKKYLEEAGYGFDAEHGVWSRNDYASLAYSDGDEVENRIARIVAQARDVSVLSAELRGHCTDWPSLYHLTSARANILRPFASLLEGARVLEIGAGCGAITRYLGECGASVLALEGTRRRAAIARERNRGLSNVEVVADSFDQFAMELRFDVVTLVGVLEYANHFIAGAEPAAAMLQRARRLLKPGGCLIIAIENQLGLKYFAGAREDHVGVAMYGLEDRYHANQAQTFGRAVLEEMLHAAGFPTVQCLAPFPDYKMPSSIISGAGFRASNFDASALASQSVRRDPQLLGHLAFSPELVWPVVVRNGLAMDLANSFLFVAGQQSVIDANLLAYHYSTTRGKPYCKETRFVRRDDGSVGLTYLRLSSELADPAISALMSHHLPPTAPYVEGVPLSDELVHIVTRDGWTDEQVGAYLRRYLDIAAQASGVTELPASPWLAETVLPGEFFDLVPQNIIAKSEQNSFHAIDREWCLTGGITVGWLLYRVMLLTFGAVTRYGRPAFPLEQTRMGFVLANLRAAGLVVDASDIDSYAQAEARVQSILTCRPVEDVADWAAMAALPFENLSVALAEREEAARVLRLALAEREEAARVLRVALAERDDAARVLGVALAERDEAARALAAQLEQSKSELAKLASELAEKEHSVETLERLLHGQQEELSDWKTRAEAAMQQAHSGIQALRVTRAASDAMELRIQELLASRSWRMTAGLRGLSSFARKLRVSAAGAKLLMALRRARNALRYIVQGKWGALWQRMRNLKTQAAELPRLRQFDGQSVQCGILSTPHTQYVAHALQIALARTGMPAQIVKESSEGYPLGLYFVICPQMFKHLPPGEKRIAFQMEQTVSSRWFTPEYLALLENSLAAVDYAQTNISNLAEYGIIFPHIFLVPIGGVSNYSRWLAEEPIKVDETCDVLFYGDANTPRRHRLLEIIGARFRLRVVGNAFGSDVHRAIAGAKVVVNLHYYEGALLETTRIYECLSLGRSVVSECAADQAEHRNLESLVRFVPVGDVAALIEALEQAMQEQSTAVGREAYMKRCQSVVEASQSKFQFMLYRLLLARRLISYSQFDQLVSPGEPLPARLVLSLPETVSRRQAFQEEQPQDVALFDGLRYSPGWIGCAFSYKYLATSALRQGISQIEIMEDDVQFPRGYEERRARVLKHLSQTAGEWDVFVGVMALVHPLTRVLKVEQVDGETYVTLDRMISMVCNIYTPEALKRIASWDETRQDAEVNTIDRFLQSEGELRTVVTLPFLVSHREDLDSTLWGISNTHYAKLIADAQVQLQCLVEEASAH